VKLIRNYILDYNNNFLLMQKNREMENSDED